MIPLYVMNSVAYVWNAEDWHTLRSKYRIYGALIGSLPSYPRQNDLQGLPLALMTEEAALLVDKGICELYDLPKLIEKPSDSLRRETEELENRISLEQADALKKKKIEQLSQKIDIIVAGKRQKMISKGIVDVNIDKDILLEQEINKIPTAAPGHLLVHLPTQHINNEEKVKLSIEALSPSITQENCIKYSVFKDLWQKGFSITNGSKFGSDYLLYPGDPAKFHALYMLKCTSMGRKFHPANLVAFGRLSVAVNKLAVLAYFNSVGEIEYQTLQWHDSPSVV
ncbi:unnamed protein product [Leptosia nina]|uniref:tRNA-splicing endonuclease subunit Sen34 n=1 Tax=Leptosia nina TaxID=320188 RepID=A0AAV1K6K7_9NEOP